MNNVPRNTKYDIRNTQYAIRNTQYSPTVVCQLSSALYICRGFSTNRPFYAKQTQFPGCQNERKLTNNNGLWKYCQLDTWWKQTQFKPNQTQSPKSQSE